MREMKKILALTCALSMVFSPMVSLAQGKEKVEEEKPQTITEEKKDEETPVNEGEGKRTETEKEADEENRALKVTRISGQDRYETAIKINETYYKESPIAILASGESYIDALVGGALASQESYPIYLVNKSTEEKITDHLKEAQTKKVYILGGERVVSKDLEDDLKKDGMEVERLWGKDRFETAQKIGNKRLNIHMKEEVPAGTDLDALFNSDSYADALTAGAFVGQMTKQGKAYYNFGPFAGEDLSGIDMAFGGYKAIPKTPYEMEKDSGITPDIPAVKVVRYGGKDRYETAVNIAYAYKEDLGLDVKTIVIADGTNYPDALAAAGISGREDAPVLLTNKEGLNESLKAYIEKTPSIENVIVLGGDRAISQDVVKSLEEIKR